MNYSKEQLAWVGLRIGLGWIMLWAFLDKVFGLGFTTAADKSWLSGTSPTLGFLKFGTHGPFAGIFQSIAGNILVDWLFMLGLLFVGTAMTLGIAMRLAGYAGALMMALIYLSLIPPEHNPLLDEHIIYIIAFLGLSSSKAGQWFGLGKWWGYTKLVKRYPSLQ